MDTCYPFWLCMVPLPETVPVSTPERYPAALLEAPDTPCPPHGDCTWGGTCCLQTQPSPSGFVSNTWRAIICGHFPGAQPLVWLVLWGVVLLFSAPLLFLSLLPFGPFEPLCEEGRTVLQTQPASDFLWPLPHRNTVCKWWLHPQTCPKAFQTRVGQCGFLPHCVRVPWG